MMPTKNIRSWSKRGGASWGGAASAEPAARPYYLHVQCKWVELTTYNLQPTYNLQLTTYNLQLTTYNLQHLQHLQLTTYKNSQKQASSQQGRRWGEGWARGKGVPGGKKIRPVLAAFSRIHGRLGS
jgi:hypothetical protein